MYFSTTVGDLFMVNVGKIKHTPATSVMGHEIHETPGEIGQISTFVNMQKLLGELH